MHSPTPFLLSLLLLTLLCSTTQAQISGNQVYGNNNRYNSSSDRTRTLQSIQTTDSTLLISTRVLLNRVPDFYFVVLGVSQEGKTVKEGLVAINARIDRLIKSLGSIGVKQGEHYVDFVSQVKIL